MGSGPPNRRDGKGAVSDARQARAALNGGDFRLARSLAQRAASDPNASDQDKHEAQEILKATTVDRAPIAIGLAVLTVLIILFTWVLLHRHDS